MTRTVHVLCFGNLWHGDDGFAIHLLRRLREDPRLPAGVVLFEAGLAGLSALACLEGCDKAVLVDALRSGGVPGQVHRLLPEDLAPPELEASMHAVGVAHLLASLAALDSEPAELVLVCAEIAGVQPFTDELTPPVAAALEPALQLVLGECAR